MTERKLHLVYEEGDRELSKLVLETIFVQESQVSGIIPKALKPLGCLPNSPTVKELVISSMQKRMSEMLNNANALIFLPRRFCNFRGANYICFLSPFEYQ